LNHARIVHLYNVKEVAPLNRLISKAFIYLFYLFVSWFHNSGCMHFLVLRLLELLKDYWKDLKELLSASIC